MTTGDRKRDDPAIEVVVFKADDGDSILLRCFGEEGSYNLLVDGGRAKTPAKLARYLSSLEGEHARLDLFVLTHIDADHITGGIRIATDPALRKLVGSVWFNDARHLPREGSRSLSTAQGDDFATLIEKSGWSWNAGFDGPIQYDPYGSNVVQLKSGTLLRLLGPNEHSLRMLASSWHGDELLEADSHGRSVGGGIAMGDHPPPDVVRLAMAGYDPDKSVPNGSSISFILEHRGVKVFIGGDAHAETLAKAIASEYGEGGVHVDLAVVPHHGSASNMSSELAAMLKADRWVVSTSGRLHGHPNAESIARILSFGQTAARRTLFFNYGHAEARMWDDDAAKALYRYDAVFPRKEDEWVAIDLDVVETGI